MTNEELAVLIRGGERDKLEVLWGQVQRFAQKLGKWWFRALDGRGGVTLDDLLQCAFLALMAASDSFDPGRNMSFIGWYELHLKRVFTEACGMRTKLQQQDPIHHAVSTEAPVTDNESAPITLGEAVPDPAAEAAFESVAERDAVAAILQCLTEEQRTFVRLRYVYDLPLEQTARMMGIETAAARSIDRQAMRTLRHPMNSRKLKEFVCF